PTFPPMGSRFRLRVGYDISGFSANAQVVLRAFQHYGLLLADNGFDWYFGGTTDSWWGTTAGDTVVTELKTIPAAQFDAVDESGLQVAAGSYAATPLALPADRLHFGLASEPGDFSWMKSSGVPFKYRYTYLSAGVNTGKGWETWNPGGAYATYYMSDTDSIGAIPVFSYYELLQSLPAPATRGSIGTTANSNNTTRRMR